MTWKKYYFSNLIITNGLLYTITHLLAEEILEMEHQLDYALFNNKVLF